MGPPQCPPARESLKPMGSAPATAKGSGWGMGAPRIGPNHKLGLGDNNIEPLKGKLLPRPAAIQKQIPSQPRLLSWSKLPESVLCPKVTACAHMPTLYSHTSPISRCCHPGTQEGNQTFLAGSPSDCGFVCVWLGPPMPPPHGRIAIHSGLAQAK